MASAGTGRIRIGTSGWQYDHWKGPFYPRELARRGFLGYYAERFDTTEVNSFFYGLPKADTVASWRQAVPADFAFAVKASRYITHMKKLKDPEASLARFRERIDLLGSQLGPILFQLPPNWGANPDRLRAFLQALPKGPRYTFEFRDPSWFTPEVLGLLEDYGAAFCIYELGEQVSPLTVTADFAYVRLHGPEAGYRGDYGEGALESWAHQLRHWQGQGLDTYLFFDNDEAGYAALDGMRLRRLLGQEGEGEETGS
ncbi:MAG TPA: DUF72 domain-containing protein [Gammaproteobacteria bacterium]|nr:DUF72 domain-containing protein [Gammaproteobacteria bacterium]